MRTFPQRVYLESEFGAVHELGTLLENSYADDAWAKELEAMAAMGLTRIVAERRHDDGGPDELIRLLTSGRLRQREHT
jgi:hypothetical protein